MTNPLLLTAAALAFLLGLAHSYLGERYILIRLFRRSDLPRLFGSDGFTRRTLRFAWHLTTIALWGLAAIPALAAFSNGPDFERGALVVVAAVFLAAAAVAAVATRGRHLSWLIFLVIGAMVLLAMR